MTPRAGDTRFTVVVTCEWCGVESPPMTRLKADSWAATHDCINEE